MPVIPARKGFGPGKAGWSGWRDKVGMTIRPGPNVFVIVAHAAWGGVPAGRIPARLFRSFHYPGDRLGKYRLDAEYTWCLDHAMLMALGPHVYSVVPEDVLAAMALDRRMVVETNWTVADIFETVIGDCQVVRRYPIAHSGVPPDDDDAAVHMGTLLLKLTKTGKLSNWVKVGSEWHKLHSAVKFIHWRPGKSLSDMVPAALREYLPAAGPLSPVDADYGTAPRFLNVPAGGGPAFGPERTPLRVGANEARIHFQKVSGLRSGTSRALLPPSDPSGWRRVYIDCNPYDAELSGIELLEHEELAGLSTHDPTCSLLAEPNLEARSYLNNKQELMPGYRRFNFKLEDIRGQGLTVNPSLVEGASLLMSGKDLTRPSSRASTTCCARSSR